MKLVGHLTLQTDSIDSCTDVLVESDLSDTILSSIRLRKAGLDTMKAGVILSFTVSFQYQRVMGGCHSLLKVAKGDTLSMCTIAILHNPHTYDCFCLGF
jgi:hypothetical protein